MRRILLTLFALVLVMPAAEAAQRDPNRGHSASRSTQQHATRPARPQASRQHATRQQARRPVARSQATRQQANRRQPARRAAVRQGDVRTSRSNEVVRGASAARVQRTAARNSIAGWQRGLPTVSYTQRECPAGTLATLARGHDDVVRCMPL